jgi:DNA helicase-2/ATP-dependent DNA helicase PcrA
VEDSLKTGLEEDTDRLENIMELVTLAKKYDEYIGEEGIEKFLTDTSLASDQDSLDGEKTGVKLMTVHASKGLEFDYVFICGLENDLFPHKGMGNSRKSGEDAEEERRLFYVAVTRAGKKLFLSYASTRTIFGTMEVNSPSEFLDDIPDQYTEREGFGGKARSPLFSIDF